MKKTSLLLAPAFLFLSCATLLPVPQESDLAFVPPDHPGQVQLKDLQMGRKLYMNHCAACHNLHQPNELPPSGWKDIMERMQSQAKIDDDTRNTILVYLTTMASK